MSSSASVKWSSVKVEGTISADHRGETATMMMAIRGSTAVRRAYAPIQITPDHEGRPTALNPLPP